MIKNILLVSVIGGLSSTLTWADSTISVGYAQAKVEHSENLKGVQVQYRYEWNSPWSVLASSSYLTSKDQSQYNDGYDDYVNNVKVRYMSLLAGPSYRFNEYVSAYVVTGFANTKLSGSQNWVNSNGYTEDFSVSESKTNFAYGLGILVNPTENLSLNLGYEASKISTGENYLDDLSVRGFSLGLGYKF